ncbi:MAG: monovalent cation/H+ antiporter complex subunit F [Pseudomonadota bacterium]
MTAWLGLATALGFALLGAGIGFATLRLVLGPGLADRVVALDFVAIALVAIAALLAILFDQAAFLDVGAALALVAFLATVAFARYAERRGPAVSSDE